ncbi:hypothetical protein HALLA_12035 [Halostagnicola larsenii XH-48]|uniref:Uncharacterized protein n=1 Tax=Halostagnicola larsenii XH-48 TaxID=797299 RepID=W0JUC4_9EURY|nr:hypothetical protein [Halostagnicola larsenii]AHG00907.1 hypothetical protein HALLA_11745 [Halostagnicola larsenii XH-48]AHG00954.1 hypothetical protein HALLA_12035 [Halostagnicola larsenii XH-48]
MTDIALSFVELAGIIGAAVALAATDAAALSRLAITVLAKKLGVKPMEIYQFSAATSDQESPEDGEG